PEIWSDLRGLGQGPGHAGADHGPGWPLLQYPPGRIHRLGTIPDGAYEGERGFHDAPGRLPCRTPGRASHDTPASRHHTGSTATDHADRPRQPHAVHIEHAVAQSVQ